MSQYENESEDSSYKEESDDLEHESKDNGEQSGRDNENKEPINNYPIIKIRRLAKIIIPIGQIRTTTSTVMTIIS